MENDNKDIDSLDDLFELEPSDELEELYLEISQMKDYEEYEFEITNTDNDTFGYHISGDTRTYIDPYITIVKIPGNKYEIRYNTIEETSERIITRTWQEYTDDGDYETVYDYDVDWDDARITDTVGGITYILDTDLLDAIKEDFNGWL